MKPPAMVPDEALDPAGAAEALPLTAPEAAALPAGAVLAAADGLAPVEGAGAAKVPAQELDRMMLE
jgi:hypothetical protein